MTNEEAECIFPREFRRDAELDRLRKLRAVVIEILYDTMECNGQVSWDTIYPKLAELVGMPDWKPSLLSPEDMERNCLHFIRCLHSLDHYEAPVITEEEAKKLREEIDYLKQALEIQTMLRSIGV